MRLKTVVVTLCLLGLATQPLAGATTSHSDRRTISVRGRSEIIFPADHVIISASVVEKAGNPVEAQGAAIRKTTAVLRYVKSLGVEERDVVTDHASLSETTERFDSDDCPKPGPGVEFTAIIGIRVVLRDLFRYDELIAGLLNNGVNEIRGYAFESTERVEKVRQARVSAIRAAREKAEYLARELGEKVGRPLNIEEVYRGSGLGYSLAESNTSAIEGRGTFGAGLDHSMVPQDLTVSAQVDVVFELVD
jgi:hypothetical protein